jgi:hypothetical protein
LENLELKMSDFQFEPIKRNGSYRDNINHAAIDARNKMRIAKRDELIAQYGYIPAMLQDAIENYNGEWRTAPLEPTNSNCKRAKKHYEVKQRKTQTKAQLQAEAFQQFEDAFKPLSEVK